MDHFAHKENIQAISDYRKYISEIKTDAKLKSVDYVQTAFDFYLTICCLIIVVSLTQLVSLWFCVRNSLKERKSNYILVINRKYSASFSLFNWIFIPQNNLTTEELSHIIAHEEVHVKQRHSFDLLVAHLVTAVFWFNPFAWRLKDAIKLNHEYLGDEAVLKSGKVKKTLYQSILINRLAEEILIPYVSSFTNSELKNRLLMMSNLKPSGRIKIKIVLFISFGALSISSVFGIARKQIASIIINDSAFNAVNNIRYKVINKFSSTAATLITKKHAPALSAKPNASQIDNTKRNNSDGLNVINLPAGDSNMSNINTPDIPADTVRDMRDTSKTVIIINRKIRNRSDVK